METRDIVAVLIHNEGRYLFIFQDKPGGAYNNTWHMVAGGVEEGEGLEEALHREVDEEVGITVKNIVYRNYSETAHPNYKGRPTMMRFHEFTADLEGGEATPQSDARAAVWLTKE